MNQEHLTENELQQFALEQPQADHERAAHIQQCAKCATAIANYRALFAALHTQEKPVLHFDLEQFMAQLPVTAKPKTGIPWSMLGIGIISVALAAIPVFILRHFFINLFKSIAGPVLYLIVTTALSIIIFQCRELLIAYREKMRLLNYY